MAQRRPGRDAGTEQGRAGGKVQIAGQSQDEGLIDHDPLRIPAIRHAAAMFVRAVVGPDRPLITVLFLAVLAVAAGSAGIDHAADRRPVARLETAHIGADPCHQADNLMTRHAGVGRALPFIACLMQVGMTDAAVADVDLDIVGSRWPPFDGMGNQR